MDEIYAKILFIYAFFLQRTHRSDLLKIFTLNTSNDAVLHKEVPCWCCVHINIILYLIASTLRLQSFDCLASKHAAEVGLLYLGR